MKKLVRPQKNRIIAGVCAGIASYLNVDVTLIRLIAVLLLVPGGIPGILPYIICVLVIPSEK